jgi:hypothetical protein
MMKKNLLLIAVLFIVQFVAKGQNFEWSKKMGGTGTDKGYSIVNDYAGNSYITGAFNGTVSFGDISLTAVGFADTYIAKLNTFGNFLWAIGVKASAKSIALDEEGNCFVTGNFYDTVDFGSTTLTSSNSGTNVFFTKLDVDGNFLWAKSAGGPTNVISDGLGIATDTEGNCYATGYFGGLVNFGDIALTATGATSAFFTKLDADGNFLWAKKAGGPILDTRGFDIATDAAQNCYVTGYFRNEALFGSTGLSATRSGFVTKLNTAGNFVWTKRVGGSTYAEGYGIATDADGNSYVTGYFEGSADFGATTLTGSGNQIAYITILDTQGNFVWANQMAGYPEGIAIDAQGNCYVAGDFSGTAMFGSTSLTATSQANTFVVKSNPDGEVVWAKRAGKTLEFWEFNGRISTDGIGNCYVIGHFEGTADFGSNNLTSSGGVDAFIFKLTEQPVSVQEASSENGLLVFPNPTSSFITIQIGEQLRNISLYNNLGELIQTETRNSFSIEHLPSGVYYLSFQSGNDRVVKSVIKQ